MHETVGGEYNATPQTLSDKQLARLQQDVNGNLMVTGPAGTSLPVSGQSVDIAVAPAVTAAAYTAGNVVGGLLAFAGALRAATLSGILNSIRVNSKSVQTTGLKLYVFNANPAASTFNDKSAPAINAADYAKLVGVYTLGAADSGLGTHTLWDLDSIGKVIQAAGTTLYGVLVCVGTPTWGSTTDITVSIGVAQD